MVTGQAYQMKGKRNIANSNDYQAMLRSEKSGNANEEGIQRPSVAGFQRFTLEEKEGAGQTLTQRSYYDFLLEPRPRETLSLKVLTRKRNQYSAMQLTFTSNVNIAVNDEIHVEFTTHDGVRAIFENVLGLNDVDVQPMGCREHTTNSLISDSRIECYLIKGDRNSRRPAVVKIRVSKAITSGTSVVFWITDVK